MASIEASAYLPPLDRCLEGAKQILSWRLACAALDNARDASETRALREFFEDTRTIEVMRESFKSRPQNRANSRAEFDTFTSAINISPNGDGQLSIGQIKEDALWLSQNLQIDEVTALRVTVLEWQSRSEYSLRHRSSYDPSLGLTASTRLRSSLLRSVNQSKSMVADDDEAFNSQASRRLRLLTTWCQERQFQFKCLEQIVVKTVEGVDDYQEGPPKSAVDGIPPSKAIGQSILESWNLNPAPHSSKPSWLHETVDFLRQTTEQLSTGSKLLHGESGHDEFQLQWRETKGVELVFTLHIILTTLQASSDLTSSEGFQSWFQYMSEVNFFEEFEIPFVGSDTVLTFFMCSLSTMATLALLNTPAALEMIVDISSIPSTGENVSSGSYLHNGKAMEDATNIILTALNHGCAASQPIALIWSIILQEARRRTEQSQDSRDHRLSQRAYDSLGQSHLSDSESSESGPPKMRPSTHRRTSFGSDTSQQTTLLEYNIGCVQSISQQDDVIHLLARSSLHGPGAFGALTNLALEFCTAFGSARTDRTESRLRRLLLQVVEATLGHVQYAANVVTTTLAILSGAHDYWEAAESATKVHDASVGTMFLESTLFMEHIFDSASSRFPFESLPFLELCLALANSQVPGSSEFFVADYIKELRTLTTLVSEQDVQYSLLEDDPYYIEIHSDLNIGSSHALKTSHQQQLLSPSSSSKGSEPKFSLVTLPAGTRGLLLSDSKPMVVRFDFKQSGFGYLGQLIQQAALTYSSSDKWNLDAILEPAVKSIALMTQLLQQANPNMSSAIEGCLDGNAILESFSDGLGRNTDIVSVVFEILENELYEQRTFVGGAATEVLSGCVQFLHALLPIQPARVWPFLGRSNLLGLDGVESRFAGIVASQEMPTGRYPFLISGLHLFEALLHDVVSRAVSKSQPSTALMRFESRSSPSASAGIKDAQVAKILYSCTKHMIDIFESSGKWKSTAEDDKYIIQRLLCSTMQKMLKYCFSTDDNPHISEKLVGVLAPSVEYILDCFLAKSKNELPLEPFIQNLHDSLRTSPNPLLRKSSQLLAAQTVSTIKLAESLVRLNAYLGQPVCRLEEQLFVCAEVLVRCFAAHESYRQPIIQLLHCMITGSSRLSEQPPSLLGYLGKQPAKWFLDLISSLDEPLCDVQYSTAVWKFLSAVVSQRQQWFAIYLLTGKTARSSLQEVGISADSSTHARSILDIATLKLTRLDALQCEEAAAILEFISLAADFWLWIPKHLERNTTFIKELTNFLARLNDNTDEKRSTEGVHAYKIEMAASIATIFAMIVHHGNESKDPTFAKQISPHLTFFVTKGISATEYNLSLHRSLQKNFESKYPVCKLASLKRTGFSCSSLGTNFFYDMSLADTVLSFDKSWARQDGKGFRQEFERANLNLSLVQAQIDLFHAWKSLAVEVTLALGSEKIIQGYMAKVIRDSLEANRESILPEGVFGKLAQSRADLAFVLLQRLIELVQTSKDTRSVLTPAWQTLCGHAPDLGQALTGLDADYDRTLTKIVYLALQAYLPGGQQAKQPSARVDEHLSGPKLHSLVLDILGTCVARGFRSIVTLLHEDPQKVVPSDLTLINAILRTCLDIPNISRQTEQLVAHFSDNQTARYASTLFSWADQLTINGDPIYGELSMDFLVELSSVPALAESIVLSGILSQISSSNLTKFLSRVGGSGPFDQPTRIHVIWSRGILPLAINLLRAIEAPIAGDVATFLCQFKSQLERASQCMDPNPPHSQAKARTGYVTLGLASEVHSLAIISSVLDSFRVAGPSAGITPNEIPALAFETGVLRSDIETRLQRRNALREDIVAVNPREEAWSRQPPSNAVTNSQNLLEQKVVEELKGALAVLGEHD